MGIRTVALPSDKIPLGKEGATIFIHVSSNTVLFLKKQREYLGALPVPKLTVAVNDGELNEGVAHRVGV